MTDVYTELLQENSELETKVLRLEQENKELSKLIRGTKDYAEVCSVCKDEVTIYPNISGRTDYTQNEVECRALAQIITRKNNLEQENKQMKSALEKIREICKCSKEMNCEECPQCDDCEELCTSDENLQCIIMDKISEVLNDK